MAGSGADVFFAALENCYDKLYTAIESRGNMSQIVRDSARNAVCELKKLISEKSMELGNSDCNTILEEASAKHNGSVADSEHVCSHKIEDLFIELKSGFASFRHDTAKKMEDISKQVGQNQDRVGRTGGGLALLLKKDLIKYKEVKTEQRGSTEIQAVEVFLPRQTFTLINVYHPDNSDINIETLGNIPLDPSDFVIMLGDFNAKSPTWGSHVLDEKGKQMEDLLTDLNLLTLNDGQSTSSL
ncbi:hypothetical protein JTE90_026519 [Oedothorax gibbosus]|uniref:Endonuclease/exonuclease/phosphatase domain-containing protein n=1 Tax=Oedothorax gibbosus TaxID=931172 RepID=A0AAV6VPJ6_9ARAC|nr:hypothetical protein JTE90_026519 [Oedothorax gibbosus]